MDYNNIKNKDRVYKEVYTILQKKGFSFLLNFQDFKRYKSQCKDAFNLAYSIAQKFLDRAEEESDFSAYIF